MVAFNKGAVRHRYRFAFWAMMSPMPREAAAILALALCGLCGNAVAQSEGTTDAAWRNFQHALGQPAAIGANADHPLANDLWRPIPAVELNQLDELDKRKFRLGFQLFHEGRLSSADSVACISCHAGPQSGVDGLRFSRGVNRTLGHFNSLSILNTSFHFRQFWDGRAVTIEDQALEPIINEVEMANTLEAVQAMLEADTQYPARFAAVYPDGVSINNMADALVHFQRINFTRADSAFMRHLQGEPDQLSETEQRGMQRFQEVGCASCHNGINLGGNSYQQLGALIPYYGDERPAGINDEGVHRRTGRLQDLHVFKVPGLHTVAVTAPYFHDGSVATLEAAIEEMAEHQLATLLSDEDIDDIAAFLRALLPVAAPLAVDISQLGDVAQGNELHPAATGLTRHRDAYTAAIIEMDQIYGNLQIEARRIKTGEVAHFDFLQFQHLEMIRHGRALQFPPAELDESTRKRLTERAGELLAEVNSLEWAISDLLRAHAMMQVLGILEATPRENQIDLQPSDLYKKYSQYKELEKEASDRLESAEITRLSSALLSVPGLRSSQ